MERLLKALEQLYAYEDDVAVCGENGEYFSNVDERWEAEGLCNELLITESGGCNWSNIDILRNNGYLVYPGEKDSFGWIIGVVQKRGDKRKLLFG